MNISMLTSNQFIAKMASPERMSNFVFISRIIFFNSVFLLILSCVIDGMYSESMRAPSTANFKCQFAEEVAKSPCNRTKSNDSSSSEINPKTTKLKIEDKTNTNSVDNITISLCQVLLNVSDDVCTDLKSNKSVVLNVKSNETCKILSESVGFDWSQAEIVRIMSKNQTICDEICSQNENLTHVCNALVLWYQVTNIKPDINSTTTTTTTTISSPKNETTTITSSNKDKETMTITKNETEHQEATKKTEIKLKEGKEKTKTDHVDAKTNKTDAQEAKMTTATTKSTPLSTQTTSNSSSKVVTTSKVTTKAKVTTKPEKKVEKVDEDEEIDGKLEVPIKGEDETDVDVDGQEYEDTDADDGEDTNIVKQTKGKEKDFSFEEPMNARPKVHPIGTFSSGYDDGDSHFFIYFLTVVGMCIAMYVLFHNKQKILAIIVEGRQDRRNRRPNSNLYRKLDTNLDEVILDNRPKNMRSMSNIIY